SATERAYREDSSKGVDRPRTTAGRGRGRNGRPESPSMTQSLGPSQANRENTMPRLLLVEDNEENRDALSRHLRRKGYEVLIAVDGREGVDVARAEAPELILMDMSLPILDGWHATRQLQAAPETRA